MLAFAKLQSAMTRLRFKDESALREIGLAKLSKTYDAYPLVEEGGKIFVLLPRGMDPGEARQLSNGAAVKRVVVLAQGAKGVAKIWPTPEAEALAASAVTAAAPRAKATAETAEAELDFEIVEE